jgi:hypothetical protein
MPTFGQTGDQGNSTSSTADGKVVSAATPGSSGTAETLTCRLWLSSAGSCNVRGVIYSDDAGALTSASTLLAVTDDTSFTNTSEAEVTMTFTGANRIALTSGQQYWIGVHLEDPGTPSWNFSRGATADGRKVNGDDVWSGGSAATWGADITSLSGPIDCYVTYSSTSNKTVNGLAIASVKTVNGLAIASVKTINGLA